MCTMPSGECGKSWSAAHSSVTRSWSRGPRPHTVNSIQRDRPCAWDATLRGCREHPPDTFCCICALKTVSAHCLDTHFSLNVATCVSPRAEVKSVSCDTLRSPLPSFAARHGIDKSSAFASGPALPMAILELPCDCGPCTVSRLSTPTAALSTRPLSTPSTGTPETCCPQGSSGDKF